MARTKARTIANKMTRVAFRLNNLAGQLGRQGVRGPVELHEKFITKSLKPLSAKAKRTPRTRSR